MFWNLMWATKLRMVGVRGRMRRCDIVLLSAADDGDDDDEAEHDEDALDPGDEE
jgi:hypothetical protein